MMKPIALLLLIVSLSAPSATHRPDQATRAKLAPEVRALVDRVQAFYEKTSDFVARFKQVYTYKASARTQSSAGKVSFLKPGMMRWDYQVPSAKSFVLSGDKFYAYDPEAMTFTIGSLGSNQLSAAVTFLWGKGRLETEFQITRVPCQVCRGILLELKPLAQDAHYQKIQLEVDPKTAQVLKSTVTDPDGSENAIEFIELKTNAGISKDQFKLNPPEGTEVIDLAKGTH